MNPVPTGLHLFRGAFGELFKKHFGFGGLFKKDPDVLFCWMSLIAHLKFKDVNPYLI